MDPTHDDHGTPGWDAINAALVALYPGQEPRHFGTALPHTLGGNDPLDGISVYWAESPRPHWHYVTYGFSELYDKQSDDAADSGYGFELTFRLAAAPGQGPDDAPPVWPMNLLQNLARYVFSSGNVFEAGHHLDANGPIALDTDTVLRHLALVEDQQLPPRDTPNGRVRFLQIVGLADDEMAAVRRWSTQGVLDALLPAMPLWITDLQRGSLLADPALAAQVEAGSARDGSTTGLLFLETLDWAAEGDSVELVLGAGQVPGVLELLPLRLDHGHALTLLNAQRSWRFEPGEADQLEIAPDSARCVLSPPTLRALLDHLHAQRGVYPLPGGRLRIRVEPTQLRDAQGNVVRTIG
ncbi:suppressor of fused domain protein [Stenotrophomonas rhizophila]|uniref:suppressor of fused domain protein n=1 Tax=Stenotrophomonas rhizophila TaxID=216778 RepID=UPI002A6B4FE7|nr:suppressor of fused domain protein [Stenotrophomonas rhizophila]MDY0957011.1 suppressor of fused domain protein [Stenotrophomonas rhizophila]